MPYISRTALKEKAKNLVDSDLDFTPTSALVYFFAASRIMQNHSITEVDVQSDAALKDEFYAHCSDLFEVYRYDPPNLNGIKAIIWHPFRMNTTAGNKWRKKKTFRATVDGNILTKHLEDGQLYPKTRPLLDLSNRTLALHTASETNFAESFSSQVPLLLAFAFMALRSHEFTDTTLTIEGLLTELEQVFGVAGQYAAELIRNNYENLDEDISLQDSSTTLLDLLLPHIDSIEPTSVVSGGVGYEDDEEDEEEDPSASTPTIDDSSHGTIPEPSEVPLNLLIKGVPGTGKSYLLNQIVEKYLGLNLTDPNIKRINVHSASDNTSFMQGVGISVKRQKIIYKEKKGGVLMHLIEAIKHPNQPYVLILEEIQENSLNELIGDLIYLIEPSKRVNVADHLSDISSIIGTKGITEVLDILSRKDGVQSVRLPSLVEEGDGLKLVFPKNLYVFCTTNYRDDKKIIEDNLMRRFDVIDLFPNNDPKLYHDSSISDFLKSFNEGVMKTLGDIEPYPDRFLVGHARFMEPIVEDESSFYKALKKVADEFKDIRDVEFKPFSEILNNSKLSEVTFIDPSSANAIKQCKNYKDLADLLQKKSGYAFHKLL